MEIDLKKDNYLREVRKLLSILEGHGNVLVPNLPNNQETTALQRLGHFVDLLKNEYNMGLDEIETEILKLT